MTSSVKVRVAWAVNPVMEVRAASRVKSSDWVRAVELVKSEKDRASLSKCGTPSIGAPFFCAIIGSARFTHRKESKWPGKGYGLLAQGRGKMKNP